jgi:cytochrome P450
VQTKIPPGPRLPKTLQTIGWWNRPIPFMERCRARYGKRFSLRLLATPIFVHLSDPDEIKESYTAPPEILHPGEGARILEPVVGRNSVILLDERPHLEQRKLMLPAFHGEKMERLSGLVREVTEREVDSWPQGAPTPLHGRLQSLTLEIILRAVFGLDPGARLDRLRDRLTSILEMGSTPVSMFSALQKDWNPLWRTFVSTRDEADRLIFDLIDERRGEHEERDDVLSMLLAAKHEDGSPMTDQELRDELMTLLVAGHETTASELAWAFERLPGNPRALKRLALEVDRGDDGDEYIMATVQETLRRRPVLPNTAPRLVMEPVEIGGWPYPAGICLLANAYLVHHDPAIYPNPYEFRPERFLEEPPGTYTWIPFGGGRRRCLGASFAMLEMRIVLRAVLQRFDLTAGGDGRELTRRRSITISPRRGAMTVLNGRSLNGGRPAAATNGARRSAPAESTAHPTPSR